MSELRSDVGEVEILWVLLLQAVAKPKHLPLNSNASKQTNKQKIPRIFSEKPSLL